MLIFIKRGFLFYYYCVVLGGYPRLESSRWLSAVLNTHGVEHFTNVDLRGSIVSYEDLVHSKSLLLTGEMKSIEEFTLDAVTPKWTSLHSFFRGKTTLRQIAVAHFGLTNIDHEFDGLHRLCWLKLDNNQLTGSALKKAFKNSNVTFDRKFCPNRPAVLKTRLDVKHCLVETLQDALLPLVGLERLGLGSNELNRLHFSELPKRLEVIMAERNNISVLNVSELRLLASLNIEYNQLTSLKRSMLVAPNNLLNLHRFKAGNNKITNVDVDTFAGMEKLYTIDLSDNELSEINIDMFRRMHSKMWGESLYYYYEEREWKEDTGYIDLQRNKFNASMKLAVLDYFVHEHDFLRVGDGTVKPSWCPTHCAWHKKGAFRVLV